MKAQSGARWGVAGQRHTLTALSLGNRPGTPFTGGWVGPKAGLDGCGKSRSPPGSDPRTIQPVTRRYVVRYKKIIFLHSCRHQHSLEAKRQH